MIYQYDQALQLPTVDLYDTQMMAMALNAAKDMYERGEQQIKDFQKAYGDFLTPITADQNWWNTNVTGRVRDAINEMYARGGDPLRNAQDRAKLSMMINNMPYGDMAFKRQRAENAKEYYKAAGALAAQNKYDKDFAMFLGEDPNQWAPDFMGITAPTQFQTLKEATNEWYNDRTAGDLTPEQIKKMGLDPRYSYKAFLDDDIMNIARNQTPGWQGTPQARYYRELAKRQLQAAGIDNPTADQVEAKLQRNIADAQQEWLINPTKGDADPFILDDYRTANDIRAHGAIDHYYKKLEAGDDGDNDGSGNKQTGYSLADDVYITSLAKAAGIEYLPKDGVDVNDLPSMLKEATKNQNYAIRNTKDVLSATGMFISPEKVAGLIQADTKNGRGFFLNNGYFKNLHDVQDIRTSYKGWLQTGTTKEESAAIREGNRQLSKDIVTAVRETLKDKKNYKLKVVPVTDNNGNNVYGMVGDDNKWHTYARVRVYISDGISKTLYGGKQRKYKIEGSKTGETEERYDIPNKGVDMMLEVGLHSIYL